LNHENIAPLYASDGVPRPSVMLTVCPIHTLYLYDLWKAFVKVSLPAVIFVIKETSPAVTNRFIGFGHKRTLI
jgi:hypothetical protein